MPNWCEGILKVRGEKENIKRFLLEALEPVGFLGESMEKEVIEDEYMLTVKTNANHFHVKGSRRNFIESNIIEWYFDDHILMLDLSGAWTIDVETLTDLSKEYQLDFKIYAFERGMEFNIDFEVHKGEIIKCEEITFNDYDWECINPTMGG